MKNNKLISVVVVNWNGGEIFKQCLVSLSKIDYPNWELIVVDNGSSDGSEKYKIKNLKYKLIKNRKNLGFAEANNIGYRKSKGEYLLFLNNDTVVKPNLLTVLSKKLDSNIKVGVIQPKIKFLEDPKILDNVGSFLTWTGFLTHVGFGEKDNKKFNKEKIIFTAKGACMMVRKSLIDLIGLFDSDFVSYFEESDFCWRVWISGNKIIYYPKTSILHKVGFSSKRLDATEVNYHSFKNRISSLIKNLDGINLFKILIPHLMILEVLSIYYLIKFRIDQFLMIQKAILWNIKNIKQILYKRKIVQNLRRRKDYELFRIILKKFNFKTMFNHFGKVESNFISKKIAKNEEVLEIGRIRSCLELIRSQNLNNKAILDIGCSTGLILSKLNNNSSQKIFGLDPSNDAIEYATKTVQGVKFSVGQADKIPFDNNFFDLVFLFDVIEHVPKGSEKNVFNEIYRVLKNNGILLLSTPNSNWLTNLLDPAWYVGHRHYSQIKLKEIISSTGLKITNTSIKGSFWSSVYMLWFYIMKWVFNTKYPRNEWLEKKEDEGYNKKGVFTLFIQAHK